MVALWKCATDSGLRVIIDKARGYLNVVGDNTFKPCDRLLGITMDITQRRNRLLINGLTENMETVIQTMLRWQIALELK